MDLAQIFVIEILGVSLLKDSFQVISLDLAGYGITGPKKGGGYSNEGPVAFLNQFVQQLNLDTFYLAGNSMGGNIAWNYAITYPNKVKKLVLLNVSGLPITALQQNKETPKEKKLIRGFQLLKMPDYQNQPSFNNCSNGARYVC